MDRPELEFSISPQFLSTMCRAAEELAQRSPMRVMSIGTGPISLAERICVRREESGCIYVHYWRRSDPDDMHDHPWDFTSIILRVGYWEVVPEGRTWRGPGSIVFHKAEDRHRVELDPNLPSPVSMILTGPVRRDWGFWIDGAFIKGRDYRNRTDDPQ